MADGLSNELGYVSHAWFRRWLKLAASNLSSLAMDWVQRNDIKDLFVLPADVPSAEKPFPQALFTLDYGLAHALHRDCITSPMSKIVLSHYLQYKVKCIKHAFLVGSMQHGTSAARCSFLWKARPPLHKSWHRDHGISSFVRNELLPPYFQDKVEILQGWNQVAMVIPWESKEEARVRIDESETMSNSALTEETMQHASTRKRPPPLDVVVDLSRSLAAGSLASGDIWDLHGRHRKGSASRPETPAETSPPRKRISFTAPAFEDSLDHAVTAVDAPLAPRALPMQYTPAVARVSEATLPFGKPKQPQTPTMTFNPFQVGHVTWAPRYTTMHSPEKRTVNKVVDRDSSSDARRSLQGLQGSSMSGASSTNWTFTNMHQDRKNVRAHAKLSSLLAIHDFAWTGFANGDEVVPEEWKIFPGPLFHHF
jgi:hypothetical protein